MNKLYFFLLFFTFLLLDIFSKWAAQIFLYSPIHLIPYLLNLDLHFNTGVALSFPLPYIIQIVISIFLIIGILIFLNKNKEIFIQHRIALALFFAGAIGNLGERILFQHVTDFIAIWKFPIFNIADSFLFFSFILFFYKDFYKFTLPNKRILK